MNLTLFRFVVIFDCEKSCFQSISMQPCLTQYDVVSCCFRLIVSEACSPIKKAISVGILELLLHKKDNIGFILERAKSSLLLFCALSQVSKIHKYV